MSSGQQEGSAARENTTGELAQSPLAKPDHESDTGDGREVVGQQSDAGAATVPQPISVESAGPPSDCGHEIAREDGTRLFPCPRPTTADATTQTERERMELPAKCTCGDGRRLADRLREINNNAAPSLQREVNNAAPSLQLSADVVGGVSTTPPCQDAATECDVGIIENASEENEMVKKEHSCNKDWQNHPRCQGDEDDSSQLSFGDRKRYVHEPMDITPRAQARDPMFELSHDTPYAPLVHSSASTLEDTPVASPASDLSSLPDDHSPLQHLQAAGNACAAVEPIPEAPDGREEDGADQPADAWSYAVSDELRTIYETIEARWEEVSDQLRADLNARYDQFLVECHRRLESQPGACERDHLREEIGAALQHFIAETKDQFRSACVNFDEWRVAYLEIEVHSSGSALRQGDQFRVQAAVFRYEVLDSLPDLERRTRARAAELWKELVEQTDLDVDALFGELT